MKKTPSFSYVVVMAIVGAACYIMGAGTFHYEVGGKKSVAEIHVAPVVHVDMLKAYDFNNHALHAEGIYQEKMYFSFPPSAERVATGKKEVAFSPIRAPPRGLARTYKQKESRQNRIRYPKLAAF